MSCKENKQTESILEESKHLKKFIPEWEIEVDPINMHSVKKTAFCVHIFTSRLSAPMELDALLRGLICVWVELSRINSITSTFPALITP